MLIKLQDYAFLTQLSSSWGICWGCKKTQTYDTISYGRWIHCPGSAYENTARKGQEKIFVIPFPFLFLFWFCFVCLPKCCILCRVMMPYESNSWKIKLADALQWNFFGITLSSSTSVEEKSGIVLMSIISDYELAYNDFNNYKINESKYLHNFLMFLVNRFI